MRRIEPFFPDLLPLGLQLGPPSPEVPFDPVDMRLPYPGGRLRRDGRDHSTYRRPSRIIVHASELRARPGRVADVLRDGHGVLLVLDGGAGPEDVPEPGFGGQIVAAVPRTPAIWGRAPAAELMRWRTRGIPVGVLLGLAPCADPFEEVHRLIENARSEGAGFVVSAPLTVPAAERHRVYDACAGEDGDEELENLLFHSDLSQLALDLEREASRACRACGLADVLPGPATALVGEATFTAGAAMLQWARRLDLMEGVSSMGWQLRRAAHALLASGRDPAELIAEDNLRIVPGFTPWVEAFSRALWLGDGEPYSGSVERWLAH